MPTRRPTQTYAACEGCLREHKSASRCLRECLRGRMLSSSVEVQWQLQLENRNFSVFAAPALRSELQKRSTYPKCLESLRECLRGAYAEPTRRLQNKQKEGKRSKFIYTWQTALSHDLFNKRLREKPTRGVAQQPTLKPTRAYAPNQDCLRQVHAVPFLYKPFHLIKKRCSI